MDGLTLTKTDVILQLGLEIIGGLVVFWILKYFPSTVDQVRAWWAERSETSWLKKKNEIQNELEEYKTLLNNPILFQAKALRFLSYLIVSGMFLLILLILSVGMDVILMRQKIAPSHFYIIDISENSFAAHFMEIVQYALELLLQLSMILFFLLFRYLIFVFINFSTPDSNISRLEHILKRLENKRR
jgi:hypothetical protein